MPSSKKKSVAHLKKLLWKEFSLYIRKRDSDWRGIATCCTCGTQKPYQQMQAGHFLAGRHPSVLFREDNVHAQCPRCNIFLHSNPLKYFRFMQSKYGDEVIEELERLDREMKQFTPTELQFLLLHYKSLNK
jgi:RNase P subunit RPR2